MKTQKLSEIIIKVMGLYYLISSIGTLYSFIIGVGAFSNDPRGIPGYFYFQTLGIFGLYLISGLILIFLSKLLSKLLFSENTELDLPFDSTEFQKVLFSCIGLYLMANSLEQVVNIVADYSIKQTDWRLSERVLTALKMSGGTILKFVIGLYLFLQSKGIVTIWNKLNRN